MKIGLWIDYTNWLNLSLVKGSGVEVRLKKQQLQQQKQQQ
jgi:hypothetical protein